MLSPFRTSEGTTWAAVSCPHTPLHSKSAQRRLVQFLGDFKPKVFVLLGDGMDAEFASVHPNEGEVDALTQYEEFGRYLRSIREALPGETRLVWCLGNHDDNIQRKDPRRIRKQLRDAIHWSRVDTTLKDEAKLWKQIPYRHDANFRLGPVVFAHGAEHGVNSDRDQCQLYAPEHGLFVSGHTHRPKVVQPAMMTSRIPLFKYFANAGCQLDFDKMDYMDRRSKAAWGHGIVYGEANARHRRGHFASVQWDARCDIWEMAR